MMKKKNIMLIITIISIVLLVASGVYAYWYWSSDINKNVVFNTLSGLDKYIVYNEGDSSFVGSAMPTEYFCEGSNTTISFYKKEKIANMDLMASINMDINAIGTNISQSKAVNWVLTKGDANITCDNGLDSPEVLAHGNFSYLYSGDSITLDTNLKVTTEEKQYTIWIYVDSSAAELSSLSGETVDTSIWIEISGLADGAPEAPVLDEGLIPIRFYGDDLSYVTTEDDSEWYNYYHKEWANAVLVSPYSTSKVYDLSHNEFTGDTMSGGLITKLEWVTDFGDSSGNAGIYFSQDDGVKLQSVDIASMDEFSFEVDFTPGDNLDTNQVVFANCEYGGFFVNVTYARIQLGVYDATAVTYKTVDYYNIDPYERYKVTGVYDNGIISMYVNGEFVNSTSTSGNLKNSNSSTVTFVGCNPYGSKCDSEYFEGVVHSVKFYERALSEAEVSANHNGRTVEGELYFWYDFEEGMRLYYKRHPGILVSASDILAYYVWVPRFKYRTLPQLATTSDGVGVVPQTIDIVFEDRDDPITKTSLVGGYMTHPSFVWSDDSNITDDEKLAGIWVGKFSTSLSSSGKAQVLPGNTLNAGHYVSSLFLQSLDFSGGNLSDDGDVTFYGSKFYGLSAKVDSHMMKSRDWGAVLYLSHSIYGKNDKIHFNTGMSGCESSINYGDSSVTCTNLFGYASNYPQSTTGNVTGIFDMGGPVAHFVMANFMGYTKYSGFTGYNDEGDLITNVAMPSARYYDYYENYNDTGDWNFCTLETCGGHALNETLGWYGDTGFGLDTVSPWLVRGGFPNASDDSILGEFVTEDSFGHEDGGATYHSVLVIK